MTISETPADDALLDRDPATYAGLRPAGGRLPEQTRLGYVWLQVADLARSLAYYEEVLGLRVHERSATSAMLGTTDGVTRLVKLTEHPGAKPIGRQGRLGLYHFAILLPDRPSLGRFVKHLADIGAQAGASDHLVSEALYLRDPDGLGIEVYADRPRSSWRTMDRQLQMASEPLDFPDVIKAAGDTTWSGMPAGTTMGHVHLHVGDLQQAADFYHSALGLDKMVWNYPGALFLAAGGYHHHLGLNTWAGPQAAKPTGDDARLMEWRMHVPSGDDAATVAGRITAAGYEVVADGTEWLATDPWGTSVRLIGDA